MADQLTTNPNAPRDWAGDIVPGALLYAYASGTTTPLTIYADAAATIPHPSPLEADGNGVFPQIFYTGAVKIIVTDPDGVVLPGFPLDPAPRSVVDTSGANTISFLPTAEIPAANVQAAIERVQANLVQYVDDTGEGVLAIRSDGFGFRRQLRGTSNQILVTNDDGIAGNPTFSAVVPTEAEAIAGTDATKLMTAQRTRQAMNAGGSAPMFVAHAWAVFSGATGAISAQGNVASVTRASTGSYSVSFTAALPSANYAPLILTNGGTVFAAYGSVLASGFSVNTRDGTGTLIDPSEIRIAVIGG